MKYNEREIKANEIAVIFIVSICYVFIPYITLLTFILFLLFKKIDINSILFQFLIVCSSLFMFLINITKKPDNDYYVHGLDYISANGQSYIKYILLFGKEPAYYTYTYFLSNLTHGNYAYWNFTNTFFSYFFFLNAILYLSKSINNSGRIFIIAVVLALFFPQTFSLSMHLERQFLAGSISLYVIARYLTDKKKFIFLFCFSILTHSSVILLYLISLIPFLKENINKKNFHKFVAFIGILGFYQILSSAALPIFGNIPFIGYALTRASKDTTYELEPIGAPELSLVVILILLYIYRSIIIKDLNNISLNVFYNMSLILSIFILINIKQAELSNRLLFYLLFLLPVTVLSFRFIVNIKITLITFLTLIQIYFFYKIDNGTWRYAPSIEIVSSSVFYFVGFDYNFH